MLNLRLRLPRTQYNELKTIAQAHQTTVSELLRAGAYRLIERYYDNALKIVENKQRPDIDKATP